MTEEDGTENEDETANAENGEAEATAKADAETAAVDEGGSENTGDASEPEVSDLQLDEVEGPAAETTIGDVLEEDDNWSNLRDPAAEGGKDLEAVYDIPVRVSTVLGKSSMQVNNILRLTRGAVVELDRKVGEPVDIYVNDRIVARGEIVVVENRLGITMTEIVKTQKG